MPDTEIDIPGVGMVAFPDSMTEAQINAAATRLYQNARAAGGGQTAESASPGSNAALGMAATARTAPMAADAVVPLAGRFASSAAVPKVASAVGHMAGNMAGGGTPVLSGVTSKIGEWAGGAAARGVQKAAGAGAAAMNAAKPYTQALSTLSGAQGALDLAQMAEPERRDIGVIGVGPSVSSGAIPMASELVQMKPEDAVKSLTDAGWPETRAKSYVMQMRKLLSR